MTSFVHTEYPAEHPGIARVEHVAQATSQMLHSFDSAKGLASLLLAAVVAALLVAANQVIDTWTDGHLLVAWIGMWIVAFAGLALLARPARQASAGLRAGFKAWSERRREAQADEQLWDLALRDARVMAEISRAMSQDAGRDAKGNFRG